MKEPDPSAKEALLVIPAEYNSFFRKLLQKAVRFLQFLPSQAESIPSLVSAGLSHLPKRVRKDYERTLTRLQAFHSTNQVGTVAAAKEANHRLLVFGDRVLQQCGLKSFFPAPAGNKYLLAFCVKT